MLTTILMVFALVLFILAGALQQPEPSIWRGRLVCFGLACWVGAQLFATYKL